MNLQASYLKLKVTISDRELEAKVNLDFEPDQKNFSQQQYTILRAY